MKKKMTFYNQEIIKCFSSVCLFVMFLHKLNISFICKNIFTKFAGNVYGYKNLSVHNFGYILENNIAAIAKLFENHKGALNLETFQLASSNVHKSYMARKASLIVILA